jgi:hypothetical protein
MGTLPRDILKWMQSLDLSYSVKNVKRDFSNGFLIAEIFSRYYEQDVHMHSFENGTSIEKRKTNWGLLMKFFRKQKIIIEKQKIDAVIYCQDNAAVPLVSDIYTILTSKRVPDPMTKDNEAYSPPFSRPTANNLVSNRMRDPDMMTRADHSGHVREAQAVVDAHNENLRNERTLEPQRFVPNKSQQKSINRVATRKVTANDNSNTPAIHFKKVEVKQIDDNVAQLRVMHSRMGNSQNLGASLTSGSQLGHNSSMGGNASVQGGGRGVVKPSIELLNTCVLSKLEGMDVLKRFDPRKDAMVCFVEDLATFPNDTATLIFDDAKKKVSPLIAENCLASPKEFWNFFNLCWTAILKLQPVSSAFKAVVDLIETVGRAMVEKDQHVPFALLNDFGLPQIVTLLKSNPHRPEIIRILYAFSVPDVEEHVNVIRKLRDGLDDFDTFVVCLATLVRLENQFTTKLLDLYLYYIVAGLGNSSPVIRATCLAMLAPIAKAADVQGHKHVISLFDRLKGFSKTDTSWQVQSALVETVAALLKVLTPSDPLSIPLYKLLAKLVGPGANSLVLQTGVVAMSQCVGTHSTVQEMYTNLVLERPDVVQRALGYINDGLSVITTQDSISSIMDRKAVAVSIADNVKATKPDNLSPAHIRLLAKSVENLTSFEEKDIADWSDVYQALRDHLVVELYEPSTCADAVAVLGMFLREPRTQMMAMELLATEGEADPPMYGILTLIYQDGDKTCKTTVADFLESLAAQSDTEFPNLVYKLLMNFSKFNPDKFAGSELELVVEKLVEE